jgi:hypothetical protein
MPRSGRAPIAQARDACHGRSSPRYRAPHSGLSSRGHGCTAISSSRRRRHRSVRRPQPSAGRWALGGDRSCAQDGIRDDLSDEVGTHTAARGRLPRHAGAFRVGLHGALCCLALAAQSIERIAALSVLRTVTRRIRLLLQRSRAEALIAEARECTMLRHAPSRPVASLGHARRG